MDAVWLLAALPLLTLALTVSNALTWPRGRRASGVNGVSVLIPARNEEATIGDTVRSALAQPVDEVLVYDDQSTDATPTILAEIGASDDRLRVIKGDGLPPGWVGKPHACHRLAEQAKGDLLLFVDADVSLAEGGVERLWGLFTDYRADVVTAVPRQIMGTLPERLILPLLHVTYSSWLPLPLIWRSRDPRFLAANGQVLAVSREAYDAAGGFAAVRDAVVDDMAFCAAQKRAGRRVVFADGHEIARCRMYRSGADVWSGFSKNIYEGLGSFAGLVTALGLYFAAFVAPWLALVAAGFGAEALWGPAAVAVGANVLQRVVLAIRHAHPFVAVALHPFAVLGLAAIAVNSWLWNLRNDIVWSGRSYARREERGG